MAHILIVEDEEAINRLIKQNLRLAGHDAHRYLTAWRQRRYWKS